VSFKNGGSHAGLKTRLYEVMEVSRRFVLVVEAGLWTRLNDQ
jgi:hypothetical protein